MELILFLRFNINCKSNRILNTENFVGINYDEDIPDRHVIRNFLHKLYRANIGEIFITKVISDLCSRGIVISKGKIIDSTIVEAHGKKSSEETRRDKDATFFKKNNTSFFGYKSHVSVEKANKIVTAIVVTKASVHDNVPVDTLLQKDLTPTKATYGDKAYHDTINEGLRENRGIKSKMMHKKPKKKEMPLQEAQRNSLISKVRSRIEHVFGRTKNEFDLNKARFFTLEKNTGFFGFIFGLYNVKVALKLI